MALTKAQFDALEVIRLAHPEKKLVPATVVTVARAADSPLHALFEWDDTSAAEAYRLGQAQDICRTAILYAPNGLRTEKRALVSLWCDRSLPGGGYRSTVDVSASRELREKAIVTAKQEMIAAINRYLYVLGLAKHDDKVLRQYLVTLMQEPPPKQKSA